MNLEEQRRAKAFELAIGIATSSSAWNELMAFRLAQEIDKFLETGEVEDEPGN